MRKPFFLTPDMSLAPIFRTREFLHPGFGFVTLPNLTSPQLDSLSFTLSHPGQARPGRTGPDRTPPAGSGSLQPPSGWLAPPETGGKRTAPGSAGSGEAKGPGLLANFALSCVLGASRRVGPRGCRVPEAWLARRRDRVPWMAEGSRLLPAPRAWLAPMRPEGAFGTGRSATLLLPSPTNLGRVLHTSR